MGAPESVYGQSTAPGNRCAGEAGATAGVRQAGDYRLARLLA
jgi:hypothetical protein